MANQVVWVDIPVIDLNRAITFYSAVLDGVVERQQFEGTEFAVLPHAHDSVSGCLFKKSDEAPSGTGILVYFNAQGRLDEATATAVANGGSVILPPHPIGPHGFRSVVLDSEGNRIALHSR